MSDIRKVQVKPYDFLNNDTHKKALLSFIECLITNDGNLEKAKSAFQRTGVYRALTPRQKGTFLAAVETKLNDLKTDRQNAASTIDKSILEHFDKLMDTLNKQSVTSIVFDKKHYASGSSDTLRQSLEDQGFLDRTRVEIYKKDSDDQPKRLLATGQIDPSGVFYSNGKPKIKLYYNPQFPNSKFESYTDVVIVKADPVPATDTEDLTQIWQSTLQGTQ